MTTNVIDLLSGQIACDSRWSFESRQDNFVIYVDDTGFEKILSVGDFAYTFAGNGLLIQKWKDWLRCPSPNEIPMPLTESITPSGLMGITVCMIHKDTRRVAFAKGHPTRVDGAMFAGSGAVHASGCWIVNQDAQRAVETAKARDPLSGGTVKYLVFSSGDHNLTETSTIDDVGRSLVTKGTVMYANQNVLSVEEAAKRDENVRRVVEGAAAGSIIANAPCPGMYNAWSSEEVANFKAALEQAFPK